MSNFQTLRQISEVIQTSLLDSRTDFLLQQARLWQEINEAGKESHVVVPPTNLDIGQSKFEFYIAPDDPCLLVRFYRSLWMNQQAKTRFKLCSRGKKNSLKVSIEINLQSDQQLKPKISTEPEMNLNPEQIHVTGLSF